MLFVTLLAIPASDAGAQTRKTARRLVPDKVLFHAFKQAADCQNCAAVALIKVAIGTFGVNGLFDMVSMVDSSITYRLRNGDPVELTHAELAYCRGRSGFIAGQTDSLSQSVQRVADTAFAIMCKRETVKSRMPLELAVVRLNNGYKTAAVAQLLGLRFTALPSAKPARIAASGHVVVYNFYHAAYASGEVYDFGGNDHGTAKLKDFRWNHCGTNGVYDPFLCDIKEALILADE
jgi:hypothetical protein